jgi:septal ring factor EnvC (AmiA/AmiB activator)
MANYDFEYETLYDRIRDLETEVERLKTELIETDNAIYEILNRLDSMDGMPYNTSTFKGS